MSSNAPLVRLQDVTVRVRQRVLLANCDLRIDAGERIAVLGANGAGKSTLLKLIHHLILPISGSVTAPSTAEQLLVFQRPALLKRSVRENIEFELRMRAFSDTEVRQRTDDALSQSNLAALEQRYARALSGGEQQRVALARALAIRPRLLLADEPTASLAPSATRDVESLLLTLHAAASTLVITTHSVAQAKRLATRIIFVDRGCIAEDTSRDEFFSSPRSTAAREYLEGETV